MIKANFKMAYTAAVMLLLSSGLALAAKMERVGGNYKLQGISRECSGGVQDQPKPSCFRVVFEAVNKTGRFDELVLESSHVNAAVKKGEQLRISAEIAVDRGRTAEVSQVVMFDVSGKSRPPMWMISRKHESGPGPAARYLEMHAPQTDCLVL